MKSILGLRALVVLAFAFVVNFYSTNSAAANLLLQSASFEDPSGTLNIDDVLQRAGAFQSFTGVLTKGYTQSVYWVRLDIAATSEQQLILRLRPSYLDHITLHDIEAEKGGQFSPQFSGDRHARSLQSYQSVNLGFAISGRSYPRSVYLRVQTSSSLLLYPQVMTVPEAGYADHRQELLYSVYLGLLAGFLVWGVVQWAARKETLLSAFVIKQVVVLMHAFAIQGYLPLIFGDLIAARTIDLMTSLLIIAYVVVSAVFYILLLREFRPVLWLLRLFTFLLVIYLPVLGLFMAGHLQLALQTNMAMAAIESGGVFLVALSTLINRENDPSHPLPISRRLLISFSFALVLAAFSSALPALGAMDGAEWSLNSPMFAGLVSSLLMTVLLGMRARNMERYRHKMAFELQVSQHEANLERMRREEQERFLGMLTHELKTPLGVARISLGASRLIGPQRDRIDRALKNINAIIDRCRITDQLEHRQLLPKTDTFELSQLVGECVELSEMPARVKVSERIRATVNSDSQLLGMCVANLIDNALKYSPADSFVTVNVLPHAEPEGGGGAGYQIEVVNQIGAAGVPDFSRLFSKYYRSPGAHSKSGSGLGLYLTHSIVQLLGHRLSFSTKDGQMHFGLWISA